MAKGRVVTLTYDITAQALAVDGRDGEGYPPEHVIGPRGTTVTVLEVDGDHWLEVTGFAEDPYVSGFVLRADTDYDG